MLISDTHALPRPFALRALRARVHRQAAAIVFPARPPHRRQGICVAARCLISAAKRCSLPGPWLRQVYMPTGRISRQKHTFPTMQNARPLGGRTYAAHLCMHELHLRHAPPPTLSSSISHLLTLLADAKGRLLTPGLTRSCIFSPVLLSRLPVIHARFDPASQPDPT